jgi:1,4-alpha-glucan branching enzyme
MGGEFGQRREWTHEGELEWWVADRPEHAGIHRWVRDLNHCYRTEPSLHRIDFSGDGFEWIVADDAEQSVLVFLRKAHGSAPPLLVACNFTPVPRENYLVGVPRPGYWREILNSDAPDYGGSGWGNLGGVQSVPVSSHGRTESLNLTLPPLATIVLRPSSA